MKKLCWLLLVMAVGCRQIPPQTAALPTTESAAGPTPSPKLLEAEQFLRHNFVLRDKQVVDLQKVGQDLVAAYGKAVAWEALLEVWNELTGIAPLAHASDVIWLVNRPPHVQCAAWMIKYRDQWLTTAAVLLPPMPKAMTNTPSAAPVVRPKAVSGLTVTVHWENAVTTNAPNYQSALAASLDFLNWEEVARVPYATEVTVQLTNRPQREFYYPFNTVK